MKNLKKGDAVIITCDDSRNNFKPTEAVVKSAGSKWITVDIRSSDGSLVPFRYVFDRAMVSVDDTFLRGGCKDGSYNIWKLWPVESVDEYNTICEQRRTNCVIIQDIIDILSRNINTLSISVGDLAAMYSIALKYK